jgi:hypothetical protein
MVLGHADDHTAEMVRTKAPSQQNLLSTNLLHHPDRRVTDEFKDQYVASDCYSEPDNSRGGLDHAFRDSRT